MKKNFFLIAFVALIVSFVFTSCYVGRPYYYHHDHYYRHHGHDRDRDYGYRRY